MDPSSYIILIGAGVVTVALVGMAIMAGAISSQFDYYRDYRPKRRAKASR